MKVVKCRDCPALIVWTFTDRAKRMPVNADPDPDGNIVLNEGRRQTFAVVLKRTDPRPTDQPLYRSHFADCPGSGLRRKPPTPRGATP